MPTKPDTKIKFSSQEIDNLSFDTELHTKVSQVVGFDGTNLQRGNAENMARKITESGTTTYVAYATPGASQSSAVWQAFKIDESTGLVITYADGNANFDNTATDLTALTYS